MRQTEVKKAAERIKKRKAQGIDGIPLEAVKTRVHNRSNKQNVSGCVFPKRVEENEVGLDSKVGKDEDDPGPYRPICLIEMVRTGNLGPNQYGFREGMSALGAMEAVIRMMERNQRGKRGTIILLDVMTAFNTARWRVILRAFRERGLDRHFIRVIKSCLLGRRLVVGRGREMELCIGVPQGSVLGLALWNIMYHEVVRMNWGDCLCG